MNRLRLIAAALVLIALAATARPAAAGRLDVEAAQAILAVQQLDGWLLADNRGSNPIAVALVRPEGAPSNQWFYLVPARGQPVLLVHRSDATRFALVPGTRLEYTGPGDLKAGLAKLLKGTRRVAMEHAPKSGIPGLNRVDAATVALVRAQRVEVSSSAELVQFTKSLWRPEGRVAHYVAAHHLTQLRLDALAYVAEQVSSGQPVNELDVQQRILRGYQVRGLTGPPPVVAVNANSADPAYAPGRGRTAAIKEGDLLLIEMSAQLEGDGRPIFASLSWVAYVGAEVPDRFARVFQAVARARDATVELIRDRVERRRAIRGFEADQKARSVLGEAGFERRFPHPTGRSLDTDLVGDGANLDGIQAKDSRTLVQGAGFTVGPAVYLKGEFGIRSQINVFIGPRGVEVTSPAQDAITPILAR